MTSPTVPTKRPAALHPANFLVGSGLVFGTAVWATLRVTRQRWSPRKFIELSV